MPEGRQTTWTDMVTLEGSPPNAEIYFWTHFKARRSFQVKVSVTTCTKIRKFELTVLKAEISYLCVPDFFPRQETKCCETNSARAPSSKKET